MSGAENKMNLLTENSYYNPAVFSERIKRFSLRRRVAMSLYLLVGYVTVFSLQSNVSMAVVDMTSNRIGTSKNGTTIPVTETLWDSKNYAFILGSFYFGNILSLTVVSRMISIFGSVSTMSFASTLTGTLTILVPVAYECTYIIAFIKMLQGAAELLMIASTSRMWVHWFPNHHRSGIISFIFIGTYLGSASSYALCGYIFKYWSLSLSFQAAGCLAVFWSAISLLILREHPPNYPCKSGTELMLEISDEKTDAFKTQTMFSNCRQLMSKPVIALIMYHLSLGFGSLFIRNVIPLCVYDILHYDTSEIGLISCLPLILALFSFALFQMMKYSIQQQQCLPRTQVMKIFAFLGLAGSSTALGSAAFATHLESVMECLLIFAIFNSAAFSTIFANSVQLPSEYEDISVTASVLAYTVSQWAGSLLIGFIVISRHVSQWRILLCYFAGIQLCGLHMYALLG